MKEGESFLSLNFQMCVSSHGFMNGLPCRPTLFPPIRGPARRLTYVWRIPITVLKPSSASFIVGTIYRPPGAFVDSFSNIEQLVKLIDDKNKEFYLLGDLNANMLDNSNNTTKHLNAIMELYQLTQTISSPTRVTMTSSSLLDVCITPTPEKLVTSRLVPIAISDHYLILTIRKINIHLNQIPNKKIEIRSFKHFNAENFISDLHDQRWDLCDGDISVDKK